MRNDIIEAAARRTWGAVALLAGIAMGGCVTSDEDDPPEHATESAITAGETAYYSCMSPLCGGASIAFDSRDLVLRNCKLDARALDLTCDMLPSDSPAMPSAFYASAAIQASCRDGARFTCTGDSEVVSCVCPDTSATSGSTATSGTTGRHTYQPIVFRKRIDK